MHKNLMGLTAIALVAGAFGAQAKELNAASPVHPEKFTITGTAPETRIVRFDIILPLTNEAGLDKLIADQTNPASPRYHKWLTPQTFTEKFGPSRGTLNRTEQLIREAGLTLVKEWSQGITVEGPVGIINRLFGVRLAVSAGQHGNTRLVAEHGLVMPASMKALGAEVIAFSNHEPHHVNSMVRYSGLSPRKPGERGGTFGSGFWFDDLKQAYGYPAISVLNGTGTTVGLLMSSAAQESDLTLVFNDENFVSSQSGTSIPIPTFTNESVDGASTVFSVDNDAAAEASLDTQASLGSAPGASGVLYVIPDLSDQSIMDGYKQIVSDNTVDVASSSFGGCDLTYLPAYNGGTDETYILRDENKVLKQGNAQGIAFVASSGDEGALGCVPTSYYPGNPNPENSNFIAGTEGPAEYPNMTGVGGTNLETTITINSQGDITYDAIYDYELALGDPLIPFDYYGVGALLANGIWGSGGGKSAIFAQPAYQHTLFPNSVVRQVPDISMHMGGCPGGIAASCTAGDSYDIVAIDGGLYGLIGTSASSPEFAGVVALLVQKGGGGGPQGAGRVGNINTYIYTKAYNQNLAGGALAPAAKQFFHLFIPGYNGVYTSLDSDYSKVLGVGTPQVANFLKLPQGTAMAGTPQTPSNP